MNELAEATAGGVAGVLSTIAIYPTVVVKTRLQAQRNSKDMDGPESQHYSGPADCLLKILRHEGLKGVFSGIGSSLPKAFLTNFVFYFAHAFLKPFFKTKGFFTNLIHGVLAGVFVQLVTTPIDLVNTIIMVDPTGKRSFFNTLFDTVSFSGIGGLYKGLTPQLLLTLNPGITNVVRTYMEPRKRVDAKSSAGEDFFIGAGSKAVATTITYPLVVAKIALYMKEHSSKSAELESEGFFGLLKTMLEIIEQEGMLGWYKGLSSQLGSAVLKEAFTNMTRHEITRIIHRVFFALNKETS